MKYCFYMHTHDLSSWKHSHNFTSEFSRAEKNTRRVLILTTIMMIVEIIGGLKFHSMALLADGWHMATHVAAFAITALAYMLARRHSNNARFIFGTGKINVLGAYTSAVILGGIALYMAGESALRIFKPQPISFNEAIPIACVGLVVNIISALLLKHDHSHNHHEHHSHGGHSHGHHHDLNLRAAYLHVMADAVTSFLAITALVLGIFYGWVWLDPIMGIVGSAVISQWAYSLLRDTNVILLDREPENSDLGVEIRKAIEGDDDTRIADLHIWQIGVNQFAAIVSIVTHESKEPEFYKQLLKEHEELVHVTLEVNRCHEADAIAA